MKKKELYKLILELQQKVTLLEAQMHGKQDITITYPSVWTSPIDTCPSGGIHDYPIPWHGTTPAPCKKCGIAPPPFIVTC